MRILVKLIIAATVFLALSCHNDVPDLPGVSEVGEYKYCKYLNANSEEVCKSGYLITERDCEFAGGELFLDSKCEESAE